MQKEKLEALMIEYLKDYRHALVMWRDESAEWFYKAIVIIEKLLWEDIYNVTPEDNV